jgi:intracellular sulfur oxidation DsrE/DsrF family protein
MIPSLRVVIHLDEREKAALALRSAKNLVTDLEGVEVEVVTHADGVEGLRAGGPNTDLMGLLVGQGVRFLVCEQALRSRNLTPENFPDYVSTVPSGIVELVVRQAEGWCYLRP